MILTIHLPPEQKYILAAEKYLRYYNEETDRLAKECSGRKPNQKELERMQDLVRLRSEMQHLQNAMNHGLSVSVDPFSFALLSNP